MPNFKCVKILLFIHFLVSSYSTNTFLKNIDCISTEDRVCIENFFRYIVYETPAAFTLFGDKPISIIEIDVWTNPYYFTDSAVSYELRRNFSKWKKYAHLFPSKKYVFVENDIFDRSRFCILLINQEACLKIIKEHLLLFQENINEKISAEEILNRITSSSRLFDTLCSHQGLLGILLGFGKNNAFAFHDIYERHLPFRTLKLFSEESGEPLLAFNKLNFAVIDGDPENSYLKKKYDDQRKKLCEIYRNGDFLEITLKKFLEAR
jgi:hypothetical protein